MWRTRNLCNSKILLKLCYLANGAAHRTSKLFYPVTCLPGFGNSVEGSLHFSSQKHQ